MCGWSWSLTNPRRDISNSSIPSHCVLVCPGRSGRAGSTNPLIVVDRVGVLAALYGAGDMAYVGGGFGRAGLHSVLEPAAWSVPVVFGPRWRESRDARLLMTAGGARHVSAANPERASRQLAEIWGNWLTDAETRREEGRRAREVIDRERGASDRTVDLIEAAREGGRTGSGSRMQSTSRDQGGTTTPS